MRPTPRRHARVRADGRRRPRLILERVDVEPVVERLARSPVRTRRDTAFLSPLHFVDLHAERFELRSSERPEFDLARADQIRGTFGE